MSVFSSVPIRQMIPPSSLSLPPPQYLADLEGDPLLLHSAECQRLLMEAMKFHLLPERRLLLQSPRTRPRKATVGALFAVGGMDGTKGGPLPPAAGRGQRRAASAGINQPWQLLQIFA